MISTINFFGRQKNSNDAGLWGAAVIEEGRVLMVIYLRFKGSVPIG